MDDYNKKKSELNALMLQVVKLEEEQLNQLTAKIEQAKLDIKHLKAEKKRLQLNNITIIKQSILDLKSLKSGEKVKLKRKQFLTNLKYERKTRDGICIYSIGGRTLEIFDDDLHEILLKYRSYIDTIILEATEFKREEISSETLEFTGKIETILTFDLVCLTIINDATAEQIIAAAKAERNNKSLESNDEDWDNGKDVESYRYTKYGGLYGYDDNTIDTSIEDEPRHNENSDNIAQPEAKFAPKAAVGLSKADVDKIVAETMAKLAPKKDNSSANDLPIRSKRTTP